MNKEKQPEKKYLSEDRSVQTQAACLNRIYQAVSAMGFSEGAVEELRDDIGFVCGHYGVDTQGAVLLAAILEKSSTNNLMDDEDLALYLGCSNIEFIRYHACLREMEKAGIIQICSNRHRRRCYRVTLETLKAVEGDSEFSPLKMSGLTAEEFFTRLRKLFGSFRNDTIDEERLLEELDNLVSFNDHLLFCRKAAQSALYTSCSDTERRMFFFLCHCYVSHGKKAVDLETLMNFTEYMEDDEALKRHFAHENMPLQQGGLVAFAIEDGFVDMDSLSLSDQVKSEFFGEIELAPEETVRHRDIISASSIQPRELFFNQAEGAQVARLEGLLGEDAFKAVQQRLASTGMRRGFNVLFYGAPGTGKTASVYELARVTGRDIFRVDMAKLKSKWVGDSEKSVKGVFRMYRSLCHSKEKAPILLFNEADAIFGLRKEGATDAVDKMENSIQNILLDEMENLDGVLIATTNLLSNLDPAFERRFIYKVEFKLPGKESRAKIWKSMIADLPDADAEALAGKYPFSGGNIENISRKSAVEYVLSGHTPDLASLESLCEEEFLSGKARRSRIGF